MKRTARSRRNRREVLERASRGGSESLAVMEHRSAVEETPPPRDPIEVIAQEDSEERIEVHFQIASENEAAVSEEKGNAEGTTEQPEGATEREEVNKPDASHRIEHGSWSPASHGGPEEPSAEDLLYNAATEARLQGETRRAIAIYRELLTLHPNHVKARNNLGLLLDHTGDHEGALSQLQLCLNTDPDNPQVLVNRGGVLGALGRFVEAEADLRRALAFDSSNAEAHFNLGLLMSRRGLWSQALPYLRRSIELDLGRATAYMYLGDALNHVDDLDGALQAYQRSVELVPNNAKAFYGLGIIFDRLHRPEEAQQMYRRSRELAGR